MKKITAKDIEGLSTILSEGTKKNDYHFIFNNVEIICDHDVKTITIKSK